MAFDPQLNKQFPLRSFKLHLALKLDESGYEREAGDPRPIGLLCPIGKLSSEEAALWTMLFLNAATLNTGKCKPGTLLLDTAGPRVESGTNRTLRGQI